MTLHLLRPAPLLALAEMLAGEDLPAGLTPQAVARAQAGAGKCWGVARADGLVVACAGVMPWDGGYEAWFLARPELAPHLAAFVRLAQLTLRCATDDRMVTARVETPAGARLARLLGFAPGDGPLWRWERR